MNRLVTRTFLLGGSALATAFLVSAPALAQQNGDNGIEEIIVTAQKREQSVQDVPIAITALTGDALQANRVMNVQDLSGLAPGVTVRPSAGGVQIPSFTIRGAVSYGVVPGSDKQVSIYLDGVYIGSPRGSIFDLPDVTRLEMLRGPQGTLFGRNATAGAVSITTRDPTGEPHVKQEFTVSNYHGFRSRTSLDLPAWGPFSAYVSFVHNYRRGDIVNAGAGQVFDRSASPSNLGVQRSPYFLGTIDNDSYFAAVKFEPSDSFKTVYKFDRNEDSGTPEGTAFVGYDKNVPLIGSLIDALVTSQPNPVNIAPDARRPNVVNNSWAAPRQQTVFGHSLTSTWQASDNIVVKNIFAYRQSSIFAPSAIDGLSTLTFTQQALVPYATFAAFSQNPGLAQASPAVQGATIGAYAAALAPSVGQQFSVIASQSAGVSKQWSDELQVNYTSPLVDLTLGGLWFKSRDQAGGPLNMQNTLAFSIISNGVIPLGNQGISYNRALSLAAYAQAEIHVTSKIDLTGGIRVTHDDKSGELVVGNAGALQTLAFNYKKTLPNFLLGVNYTPTDHVMLYAKYSTAFVSGGSVAGIPFEPEKAKSWEAGIKADMLDRRLRTNLALFWVKYDNYQTAQSGTNFVGLIPNANLIPTFILPQGGPVYAKGFELEITAKPAAGLLLGGSLSYTDTEFKDVNAILAASAGATPQTFAPTLRPDWTGGVWGQYETPPLFGDANLLLRVDANWRDKLRLDSNSARNNPVFSPLAYSPASWIVNGRAALRNLDLGGVKTEVAAWVKNLTQNRAATFALILSGFEASANFQPARTYGVDLTIQF
ncbi:MAG TPA: TonB-dependent receptor [Sphingobium sp.]|uniref:TonB-dependent receptor n=1 Tax=Sphingobium sp. TaxID=1912891 RepID=UPI002ECFBD06